MAVNYDDLKTVIKVQGSNSARREIPEDFEYNPKKVKHLKHILHNVSVALGTLSSAFNEFSKFKGPEISPDGQLGGKGYILPIKKIKQAIQSAIYDLNDIADCIADELNNPRWGVSKDKDVKRLIKEKNTVVEEAEESIRSEKDNSQEDTEESEIPKISKTASDKLSLAIYNSLRNFFGNNKKEI